jgi:sarcosine oxidase subunit gamma
VTVEVVRTAPLHLWAARFARLPDGVQIITEPYVAQASLRLHAGAEPADLGPPLPPVNRWVQGERSAVIGLGPDEWLVTDPFVTPAALERELRDAVGGRGAVVDVSAQRTTLRLHGAGVRDVLATGCALDLHPSVFPAGSAAQTMIGRAGVVLLALDDTATGYTVLVRATFARYLASWLLDAAQEHLT